MKNALYCILTLVVCFYLGTLLSCSSLKKAELPAFTEDAVYQETNLIPLVRLHDTKGRFFCSGTVISNDYVLTAAHCVDKNQKVTIEAVSLIPLMANLKIEAKAVAINRYIDYALIQGDFRPVSKMKINTAPDAVFKITGPVTACGFPMSGDFICLPVRGPVSNYGYQFSLTGVLYPGMSGGPVVDVGAKEIIFVNSATGIGLILVSPVVNIFEGFGIKVVK